MEKGIGVICDHKIPTNLNRKFYHTTIHLAIVYGTGCGALRGQ